MAADITREAKTSDRCCCVLLLLLLPQLCYGCCRFVADGVVPAAQFCTTISSRSSSSNNTSGNGNGRNTSSSINHAGGSAVSHDAAMPVGDVCTRVLQGTRERFVFLRGVQWSAPDINNTQLSQALMNLWPTRFPTGSINGICGSGSSSGQSAAAAARAAGGSPLVAHAGVAGIAQVRGCGIFGHENVHAHAARQCTTISRVVYVSTCTGVLGAVDSKPGRQQAAQLARC